MTDDSNRDTPSPRVDPDQTVTRLDASERRVSGAAEHTGQTINQYTLVRLLGEGGFGTVWLAEQREPVRREVALKIIKLGMDTREVIARFEAERQALAVMDHPNIAKVFDAGSTETGRPYFVMEYAEGEPFTRYCDEHKLSLRGRLMLFQKVCHAVQHAHQKGIIHRDIKPSNVLVATVDGEPTPKVIDFGIAKATEARLTEHTMFTEHGQVIGTPAYMSPEQAGMTGVDIDTRSDVYALGVLLYEAVTGETPFNAKTLLSAGLEEIRRIIREVDPPKPSTRVSRSGDSATTIAGRRAVDPRRLGPMLHGDIDWIVMKALEKDRSRRYQTATGFAEDIQRYLRNEPVLASPPSRRYRLGKFVRRNRRAVIAAGLVLAALIAGTVGTTIGLVRATQAERLAVASALEADRRAEEARVERNKAEQVAAFLTDMLAGVGAQVAQGADTTLLRGILEKTGERIGAELATQPEVEAKVRSHLGDTYLQIRDFERAEANFLRTLDLYRSLSDGDATDVARSLGNLGMLRNNQNRFEEAAIFQRESLAMWRRLNDEDATRIPWAMMDLGNTLVRLDEYDEAETLLTGAIDLLRVELGEDHEDVGVAYNSIGNLKQRRGDHEEAERYYRLAIDNHRAALGDGHPFVATNYHNLGFLLSGVGRNKEAIEFHERSLERARLLYPDGHEQIASNLVRLAILYRYDDERSAEAPAMLREAISLEAKLYGESSREVARSYYNLGDIFAAQRRDEDALDSYNRAAELYRVVHEGAPHNDVAVSLALGARMLARLRRYDEASAEYERVIEMQTALFGPAHAEPAITLVNVGSMHRQAGNFEAAKSALFRALEIFEAGEHGRPRSVAAAYENLGRIYRAEGQAEDAAGALRTALAIRRDAEGPDARSTLGAGYSLAGPLIDLGAFEEAESLLLHVISDPRGVLDARTLTLVRRRYADLLLASERLSEGIDVLEECHQASTQLASVNDQRAILEQLVSASERLQEREPSDENEAALAERKQRLEALNAGDGED